MKYEFTTVTENNYDYGGPSLLSRLNTLGKDGWSVVSSYYDPTGLGEVIIIMQRKSE